jgi:NADH-quinone oxidoreductase subunit L
MFLALGLGAYEVAVFHVITHAFFKASLVLRFGSVIHALHGEQDMQNGWLKGNDNYIYNLLISSLAISAYLLFSGFSRKTKYYW